MVIRIYTDGACSENPGPGGWAAVFSTQNGCKIISGNEVETTNNRMELSAAVEALEKIHRSCSKDNKYELYSDSAYVVNSIENDWIEVWKKNGWQTTRTQDIKNKDPWDRYLTIRQKLLDDDIDISIIKIKGHAGHPFNEYVDKLAKEEVLKAKAKKRRRKVGEKHA